MKENNKDKFEELLKLLENNFKFRFTGEQTKLYWNKLRKWKINTIERGFDYLIDKRKYSGCPTIGEINKAIENSRNI